jgi:hypothetical protein
METSMAGTLRDTIHRLAVDFAAGVLGVVRGASLEDILAETGGAVRRGPGRPPSQAVASRVLERSPRAAQAHRPRRTGRKGRLQRRSASDIGHVVDKIVELLSGKSKGLRAEQIRAALDLSSKELPRPIALALSSKKISKTGQKRATTYFARGAASAATGGKAGRAKGSRKVARKAAKRSTKGAKGGSVAKPVSRTTEATASGATEAT